MADQDPAAGTPGPRSTGPRLAHDLRAIREARNVSLDDVQRETRMPGDILRRFEDGELVNDPHYNEVYLRNLLKSYAQALGLSPQEVSAAYEKAKTGAYDGELRRRHIGGKEEPAAPERPAPAEPRSEPAPASAEKKPAPPDRKAAPPPKKPTPTAGGTAPAVAALSSPPKPQAEKKPAAKPSEPMPKRRVQSATAASQPIEKSWGLIIGGTVVALAVIGGILWFLFRGTGPEPEVVEAPPAAVDTSAVAAVDTAAAPTPQPIASTAPPFQTPITLTVVAGGEPLEEFRVKVDDDARTPYWIEPGNQQTFTAQDRITVWGELSVDESGGGEYDGARLQLQGIEWTPPDGQVFRIDAARGQAVLDSLARVAGGTAG
ncbi:MAG: helix-turn-helix transcriptional regulator [Rhodothermales bacterium]